MAAICDNRDIEGATSDPAQPQDVFAAADVFARPEMPMRPPSSEAGLDPGAIMASIGAVPYEWSIGSDSLTWGANAVEVLKVGGQDDIRSGRAYAKLLDPGATASRFDAVMKSFGRDEGAGVPYQVQYSLRMAGAGNCIRKIGRAHV